MNTGIARLKLGRMLLREGRAKDAQPETLAGYQILVKQTSQSTSYKHSARKDLTAKYEALNQPTEARRYRAELAQMDARQPGK